MYPATVKVEYFDEFDRVIKSETALVYVDSFADAAEQVENYFGDCLTSMSIHLFEEGALWRVPNDVAAQLEENL